ncbi:MAG TPA: type II toxin-antitoxin system RelE/ParE family toxin [Devosia sp.]|nr:type II toxin-antitoxin system RelE/ParE family toxin [Devosia sp.]
MHTVVETPAFLASCKVAGVADHVRAEIVSALASNPELGDLVVGTGGLRKFRFARPGGGKSGGFRVLAYFLSEDYPVFLIGAFGKNQKANLTQAEKGEIATRLKGMAANYAKKGNTR